MVITDDTQNENQEIKFDEFEVAVINAILLVESWTSNSHDKSKN